MYLNRISISNALIYVDRHFVCVCVWQRYIYMYVCVCVCVGVGVLVLALFYVNVSGMRP